MARLAVGLAACGTLWEYTPRLWRVARPEAIQLPYFEWSPAATPAIAATLWVLWLVNGVLFTVGRRHRRTAGAVLTLVLALVLALDQQWYSNHLYLIALLVPLLSLSPREGGGYRRLPVGLARALVVTVYVFAGLAKLNPGFLSGAVLGEYLTWSPPAGLLPLLAWVTVISELAIGPLLSFRATRPVGWVVGCGLHAGMVFLRSFDLGITMFGLAVVGTYPLFGLSRPAAAVNSRPPPDRGPGRNPEGSAAP